MSKHTPTPWKLAEATRIHIDNARLIRSVNEGTEHGAIAAFNIGAAGEIAQINAAFIVEACNSHETLVAENARLREALRETMVALNTARIIMDSKEARDLAGDIVNRARTALADSAKDKEPTNG